MDPNKTLVELDATEWKLVRTLRELPPGPLRDRAFALAGELAAFASDPRCNEVQGDGVPCASVHASCECCREVTGLLDQATDILRRRSKLAAV